MATYAIQEVFDFLPQRVARCNCYLLGTLRGPENTFLFRAIQVRFRLTPDHGYFSPLLPAQPANLDLRGKLSCVLRGYESHFLVLLCPVPFAPASNLVGPHVQEVIADVEGMWREVRDDFPEALGR